MPLILTAAWVVFDLIDPFGLKLSATRAAVGINPQLNYQGKIADSAGTALTDGNYNFIFELYDSLGDGTMLWSETWSSTSTAGQVTINEGIFSVTLGTANLLTASIFNSDNLYLQIRFDDDADGNFDEVFSPRKRLTASPYSFNSDMIDGIHATTTATANQLLALDSSAGLTINSVTTTGSLYVAGPATFAGALAGAGFNSAWDNVFNATSSWTYFSYNFDNLLIATTTWSGNLTVSDELFAPAARLTVLNATTTNIDNLTVYSSVSLPNNSITDAMVADNITASNYLSLANWYATTTDGLAEGSNNLYYTTNRVGDYLDASTTIQTYFSNAATAFSWGNHATAGYLSYPVASSTYLALTDWYATTTWSGNLTVNGELFNSNDSRLSNLNASTTRVDNLIAYDGITLGGVYRNTWPAASGGSAGSWWATSSNSLIGYPDLTGDYSIVVGAAATTSNVKFEVNGSAKIGTDLTIGTELLSPAARFAVLNATTTNIDNLTVYSSVSLPNNAITDLMVADNITASNYLSLANWFSTTTHANIASLPSLSITESQISDLAHYTNADTGDYLDASTTIQTYFSNAATAFSWGNHATAGYLSYPVASSTYLALTDWYATTTDGLAEGSNNLYYTTARVGDYLDASTTIQTYFSNAATAFSWGDHATAGYLSSSLAATTYLAVSDWFSTTTWAGGNDLMVLGNVTTTGQLSVGSGQSGDSLIELAIAGVPIWVFGVDDTDDDRFVISAGGELGVNNRFVLDAAGNATTTGSIDASQYCLNGTDCITTWPTDGSSSYLLNQWLDTTNTPTFLGLNASSTNIDTLTVYDSISLPNDSITDLMVADNITASNYLSLANWYATTTDGLAEGSNNLYYTTARVGDYLDASTTIQTYFSNAATAFSWGDHATAGYLSYPVASSTYLALTDWYATTTWAGGSSLYVATTLAVATSTPWDGYELAVTGDGVFSGNLYVLGNATSSHLAAQEICLNGSCRTSWPEGGSGSSLWTASGNNIYYNSGNVGIATTSPTYALDVWGNARLATSTANVYLDFFGQYYTAPQNQSTNTATTSAATGASATWSNPTNITASDNSYASKTIDYYGSSGALNATNFGFAIPTGATINGIVLDVEGKISSGSFVWTSVRLLKNGSAVGDNKTSMSMFTGIDKTLSTGGDSDLWGTTWTAEDINNTNFGATITLEDEDDTTGTVYVDHITIKVYYSYSVGKSTFASSIGIDKDNELFKISTSTGLTGKSIFSYNVAGNVGIGVDNASSTLEVAGSGRFWGDLRVGGNLATTSSARVGIVYQTGYGLVMENNGGSGYIHTDAGAHLTSGGVWTDASSEALKENFEVWNNDEVLSSIKTLAMVEYNYISEDDSVRHFGAMAEDWYDTFGLGDNVSISAKDVAMVALKGIQGLIERVDKLDEKISPATTTKTDSLEVKVIDSGWENYTLAVADNQIINENVYVKGVQVKELALFSGTIIVVGEGRFVSRVTFDSEVNFNGPVYFNKDSAGFVRLKAMATSTEVLFENEYRWPPVITVTPKSDLRNSNYWVAEETTKGFRIVINPIYNEDLDFSWQAVAVKDFIGQVAGAQETAATILGCTDAVAINFSPVANQDDGSCLYEQTVIVEDGSQSTGGGTEESQAATTEPIADISTVESTTEPASTQVLGCTDSSANNYNSAATQDDGSCQYAEIILSPSEVIDSPIEEPAPVIEEPAPPVEAPVPVIEAPAPPVEAPLPATE